MPKAGQYGQKRGKVSNANAVDARAGRYGPQYSTVGKTRGRTNSQQRDTVVSNARSRTVRTAMQETKKSAISWADRTIRRDLGMMMS